MTPPDAKADKPDEFRPGMIVEWYRGKTLKGWPDTAKRYLESGRTYEIAAVHEPRNPLRLEPFLSFTDSPIDSNGLPMQFDCRGFRPVSEWEPS